MFDKKVRYKMYKAGKNWMVAGITTVAAVMGMVAASNSAVHADQVQTQPAAKESKNQAQSAIQGQEVKLQSSAKSTDASSSSQNTVSSQAKAQASSSSAASSSSQASQESSADKSQAQAESQTQSQSSQAAASSTSTKADDQGTSSASQSNAASTKTDDSTKADSPQADTTAKTDTTAQADNSAKTDASSQAQSSSQQKQAQKKSQTQKAFRTLAAQPDSASDQATTTVNDDRANASAKVTIHYKGDQNNTISQDTVLDIKFHRDYEVDAQNNPVKVGDWTFQSISQNGTKIYGLDNPTLTDSTDQADIYGATLYAPNIDHYDRGNDYRYPYSISLSKAVTAPGDLNQEITMTYQREEAELDINYRVTPRKPWNQTDTYGDKSVRISGKYRYGDQVTIDYQKDLPEGFYLDPNNNPNLKSTVTLNDRINIIYVFIQPVNYTKVNITLHDETTGKDIQTYNDVQINGVPELSTLAKKALIANSANSSEKDFTITSDPFASMTALPANNTSYTINFKENIINQEHVEHLMIPDALQVDEGWLPELAKILPQTSSLLMEGFANMDELRQNIHDAYYQMLYPDNENLSDKELEQKVTAKTDALMSHIHYYSGTLINGGSGSRLAYGDYSFGDGRTSGKSIDVAFEVKYNCFTGQTLSVKLDPSKFTLPEIKVPAGYKVQVIGLSDPFGNDQGVIIYNSDSKIIQQGISNIIDYLNEYYLNQRTYGELGLAVDSDGNLTSTDEDLLSAIGTAAYQAYASGSDAYYRVLFNKFSGNSYNLSENDFWKYLQIMLSPLLISAYQKNAQYQPNQGNIMYEFPDTFFTLVPEDQHVTVQYKDGDKVVASQNFNGKTDQTITLSFDKVPANYDVDGDLPSTSYKLTADGNQIIVINLKHQTETVPESKTIKRTIKVTTPDGKTTTKVQTANSTRTNVRDKVTGNVTNGAWNTGHFDEFVDIPAVAGYTPSQTKVEAQDVDGDAKDSEVDITYTANKQTVRVRYMDGDKEVAHEDFNGHTDETTNLTFDKVPANYDVDGKLPDSSYKFTADGNQTVIVNLKHQTENVPDAKTVTRTINVTTPDGKTKTIAVQKADLKRTNVRDKVTGNVTDGAWNTGHFDEFTDIPAVAGYTPSQAKVKAQDVDGTTQDSTVNITYTANKQHVTVQYKDGDKVVASQAFDGKTGQTINLTFDKVPANYEVDGKLPSSSYTFTADGNQVITINLKHKMVDASESKSVTRTIIVIAPDGKQTKTIQLAGLERAGVRDEVTNQITYGAWDTSRFDEFTDIPAIAGYTPSQAKVAAQDVDSTTPNSTVTITYTANKQTGKISYVDQKTNEEIKSEPLNGVTDGDVAVKIDVPTGYHEVSGQNIPASVKATADGIPTVTVYVAKDETPVNPDKPVTPDKPTTPDKPVTPSKPTTPTKPAEKPTTPAQKPAKKQNAGDSQADANRQKLLEKERKARLAAQAAKAAEQADAEARAKARAARAEAARKAVEAAQAKRNAAAAQAASESRSNSLNTAKAQAASETTVQGTNAQNAKTKSQKAGKLPQTGDQNNGEGAVVLGALAGILGLFGLGADRKRRHD